MNLEDILLRGLASARPLASAVPEGTLYYSTDTAVTEQSRGSAWVTYSDSGSAGITSLTGNVTATGPGAAAATIANDAVTYSKMQNVSASSRALGRNTVGAGDVEEVTLSQILDWIGSAAQGDILYRGAASWSRLAAGVSGQFLKTQGAGANPIWDTVSAGSSGPITLLRGASGVSTSTVAVNLDTIALSGLTLLDSIQVVAALHTDTAFVDVHLVSVTDANISLINLNSMSGGSAHQVTSFSRVRDATATLRIVTSKSGNGTASNSAVITTPFTNNWTLGLRSTGISAGNLHWSWAVYKLAGQ